MANEREDISTNTMSVLRSVEYDINGNSFRAYYDADNKLVFVLDDTTDALTPNALLIINPVGDRKWDDILSNDYAVDLETVRPKKDNKYQKLDIEYTGLAEYDDLIRAYDSGRDITTELAALAAFRLGAARRAAAERLALADATADKARATIEKTDAAIVDATAHLRGLKSKLTQQRREIGREPTKQSAAKILRTESQIDATNDKIRRAKKRLDSAQRRLAAAAADADSAREILDATESMITDSTRTTIHPMGTSVAAAAPRDVTTVQTPPVPVETVSHDEIKPLLDNDPEILDQGIAFRPIEFNINVNNETPATTPTTLPEIAPAHVPEPVPAPTDEHPSMDATAQSLAPLSFVPPVDTSDTSDVEFDTELKTSDTPVLDTLTSISAPQPNELEITQESFTPISPIPVLPSESQPAQPTPESVPAPAVGAMPEISVAPVSSDFRPVSPITGVAPVGADAPAARARPTKVYYIMLGVLIVLSIFTLWLYQRNTTDNTPDLSPTVSTATETVTTDEIPTDVLIETTEIAPVQVTEPTPTPTPIVLGEPEPAPMPEPKPEPVPVTPEPKPVVVPEPTPEPVAEPVPVTPTPEPAPEIKEAAAPPYEPAPVIIESEEDIISSKPSYNVSQQENMFVADAEYETDTQIDATMPICEDGSAPDIDGCCTGEQYVDMGDGTMACCNANDDCFPPLF